MKSFTNTFNNDFTFNSCETCDAKCCKSSSGTIFSQLILEDFEIVFENFPILFTIGDLGFLKPVVLLTNGKDNCRYLQNNQCTIYEKRPSVCRIYPLSPHLTNEVFIDLLCPTVNQGGEFIIKNGVVEDKFHHPFLDNYQNKYIKMHQHFEKFNKKENLLEIININEICFFAFKEDFDDFYLKMHLTSLKKFDNYFKV